MRALRKEPRSHEKAQALAGQRPNPANTQTKLIVSGINGEVKIVLSDVQGRILKTITTEALSGVMEQTIDLNELVEGVYYIRIQNSDINRTQKLIVK